MKMLKNLSGLMADRSGLTKAGKDLMADVGALERARSIGNTRVVAQLERQIIDRVCNLAKKYGHYIDEL